MKPDKEVFAVEGAIRDEASGAAVEQQVEPALG